VCLQGFNCLATDDYGDDAGQILLEIGFMLLMMCDRGVPSIITAVSTTGKWFILLMMLIIEGLAPSLQPMIS